MFRCPRLVAPPCHLGTRCSWWLLLRDAGVPVLPETLKWKHMIPGSAPCRGTFHGTRSFENRTELQEVPFEGHGFLHRTPHARSRRPSDAAAALHCRTLQERFINARCSFSLQLSSSKLFCSVQAESTRPSVQHSARPMTLQESLSCCKTPERSDRVKIPSQKSQKDHDLHSAWKEGHCLCCFERRQGSQPLLRNEINKILFPQTSPSRLWTRRLIVDAVHGLRLKTRARRLHEAAPLRVAVDDCLSAENEARCRRSLEPNAALYQKERGKSWAAVLICLCSVGGEPAFLFTLRSSKLKGRHKGDVSFAGGKKDPSDRDVVHTALREAREELGVTVTPGQVWGLLKPLSDMYGMRIAPVLANVGPVEALSFRPNPSEVEEIFTLTLAHVCRPENRGYTHFRTGDRYGFTLPVFRNGKHRVWGLTAVALDHTLKIVVPP
ncbi:mitochondrial coenzyme A diphosphatase NUDT8 [Denticeps clupeoides]|uniref:Nudix hydrolase domain-containing protein n=1 Tax=Denticeps clupeoides TaxID=299321 RepID=A0AAY4C9A8_9TELE|nr:nucleoside diphosphate-linked moiety X motif 8 [Denticeps clupeoides]